MNLAHYSKDAFAKYLKDAWDFTRENPGERAYFHSLCRRGVLTNWRRLTPICFLEDFDRCVAAIRKKVAVVEKYDTCRAKLFRHYSAQRIVADGKKIWAEWEQEKCNLNWRMVDAVTSTAKLIARSWGNFQKDYLPQPVHPESESLADWCDIHARLDWLPMVGWATGWYLIRNLYGAPFFKPDMWIERIAWHFFPKSKSLLNAIDVMSQAARKYWNRVCDDEGFKNPVHLGEVDYILWWYASQNDESAESATPQTGRRTSC
jgi:hypothetical protein